MPVDDRAIARLDDLIMKAESVLATHRPNPPNVIGFPTLNAGAFTEWQTQTLAFLMATLGENSVYVEKFRQGVQRGFPSDVKSGQGILRAVREDVELGYLGKIQALITADIFSDFLDMGEHLVENGYVHPAASLAGAVLERGLRDIATEHEVKLKGREDIGSLNGKCAAADVYNRLVQKKVQVWNDVRNHADHGEFEEYTEADVRNMLSGVRDFLGTYLA
jgi:hypothetical protein